MATPQLKLYKGTASAIEGKDTENGSLSVSPTEGYLYVDLDDTRSKFSSVEDFTALEITSLVKNTISTLGY